MQTLTPILTPMPIGETGDFFLVVGLMFVCLIGTFFYLFDDDGGEQKKRK